MGGSAATCCTRREDEGLASEQGKTITPAPASGSAADAGKSSNGRSNGERGGADAAGKNDQEFTPNLPADSWKVVNPDGFMNVRAKPNFQGDILGRKEPGDIMQGVPEGRWLKLSKEAGYILIWGSRDNRTLIVKCNPFPGAQDGERGSKDNLTTPLLAGQQEPRTGKNGKGGDLEQGELQDRAVSSDSEEDISASPTRIAVLAISCIAIASTSASLYVTMSGGGP